MSDPGRADFEVLVPHAMRRAVITTGQGEPLPLARGRLAGRLAEVIGRQARLELWRGDALAVQLDLPLWGPAQREGLPPLSENAQTGRMSLTTGSTEIAGELTKVRPGRNPLAQAARYWALSGEERTWFWADGGAPDKDGRDRVFRLWRDRTGGPALVEVTFVRTGSRRVESAVAATVEVRRDPAATDLEEELAVLVAVGGFNVEVRGRNAKLRRAGKWLAEYAEQKVTDSPFDDGDLGPVDYGP